MGTNWHHNLFYNIVGQCSLHMLSLFYIWIEHFSLSFKMLYSLTVKSAKTVAIIYVLTTGEKKHVLLKIYLIHQLASRKMIFQ